MTADTQPQTPPADVSALLAYLESERQRRCQDLLDEAQGRVREIETSCVEQKERQLAEGRRVFAALHRSVTLAVAGPARRDVDALAARKMGDAVEGILARCRDRLREFAAEAVFAPHLEYLLREAVDGAREVLRVEGVGDVQGVVRVAPADVACCTRLIEAMGCPLEVAADADVWGGVVLDLAGGKYCLRNTLSSRMMRRDHDLRMVATTRIHYGLSTRLGDLDLAPGGATAPAPAGAGDSPRTEREAAVPPEEIHSETESA